MLIKIRSLNDDRFVVSAMRFQVVNRGPVTAPHDKRLVIDKNPDYCWTTENDLPGYVPCLILRVEHEVKHKTYKKDYLDKFNKLTANAVKLKQADQIGDSQVVSDNDPLRRIGDSRIGEVQVTEILPIEKLNSLNKEREEEIKERINKLDAEFRADVEAQLDKIEDSLELKEELDVTLKERQSELCSRINEELDNRVDSIMADIEEELKILRDKIAKYRKNGDTSNPNALEILNAQYQKAKQRYNRESAELSFDKQSLAAEVTESFRLSIIEEIKDKHRNSLKEEESGLHQFHIEKETE